MESSQSQNPGTLQGPAHETTPMGEAFSNLSARHEENLDALIAKVDLYESIIEHFPGGLCAFDKDMNMTVCNEQLKQLLDYPDALFADGLPTIEELFRFKAERGEYGPGYVEKHVQARLRLVAQRRPHRYERELPDDTIIEVRGRPLADGGFVTTYQDISGQRHDARRLEALIESFPGGIAVFDHQNNMTLYNENLLKLIPHSEELFAGGAPTLEAYVWHNAKVREHGTGMASDIATKQLEAVKRGEVLTYHVQIDEETSVHVTTLPLKSGGFVETHTEIAQKAEQTDHLKVILENFPGGVALYDRSLQMVLHNDAFRDLLPYPDTLFEAGLPSLEKIISHDVSNSGLSNDEASSIIIERLELAGSDQPHCFNHNLADGTIIEMRGAPTPEGGYLTTCTDITETVQSQAEAIRLANYSAVTGLPNRSLFQDRLNLALAQAERGMRMALLHVDLHNFESINDISGQQTADKLLGVLGNRFLENKRDTDTFAHLGADEFAVIQVGIDEIGGAEVLARRILKLIREPIEMDGAIFELDACIGIAFAPENGTFSDELIMKANAALNEAKDVGSGMIMFFHSCANRHYI